MAKERRKADEMKDLIKEAQKEAIREWLDDKYKAFGKWSFLGLMALLVSLVAHTWLTINAHEMKSIANTAIDQLAK